MSQFLSTGALERAIRSLGGGGALALDQARASAQGFDQLQELEAQIQVPIWGVASSGAGWEKLPVAFDVQFVYAPQQRDSPLVVPHFSFGPVVGGVPSPDGAPADPNNPDSLVAVSCQVVEWGIDQATTSIIGAVIGIGVSTVGGSDVRFDGYLHLTFQGYGMIIDTPTDVNVGPQS